MQTIGAVSYLNARPLVAGLDRERDLAVSLDVPSRLLQGLLDRRSDVALCPVIDYQTSSSELVILPAGAIGASGETLTVRVFSRRPLDAVETIHVDTDSHTSVALLQIVLHGLIGRVPPIRRLEDGWSRGRQSHIEAVLLIGDKVVAEAPTARSFPHELDLGRAWRDLTGRPFVFACWMARADTGLGDLPRVLETTRQANLARIPELARATLPPGWTEPLARRYLGRLLRYDLGPEQCEAMTSFWRRCAELGLVDHERPMRLYDGQEASERETA